MKRIQDKNGLIVRPNPLLIYPKVLDKIMEYGLEQQSEAFLLDKCDATSVQEAMENQNLHLWLAYMSRLIEQIEARVR